MRSHEWDAKRQQRLDIDGHCCAMCGRQEAKCKNGLQVHHITYQRLAAGKNPDDYAVPVERKILYFPDGFTS